MSDSVILAIDQGTSNTKCILVDHAGQIAARASSPLSQTYPHPGWVEQDPLAIWQSVVAATDECLERAGAPEIVAIAVTNQRETVTAWQRSTGQPLGPAIGWQCLRTAEFCADLAARGLAELLERRTGLTINPMFAGSKIRWLLRHLDVPLGDVCVGTMDSWLLWQLTGGRVHACDWTNASRTQLFDLDRRQFAADLLEIFEIPPTVLPEPRPSGALFGHTLGCGRLPAGIPIASAIGDSHGAMVGHGQFQTGTIKATYGTGSSLMSPTARLVHSHHGISSTIAWSLDRRAVAVPQATYGLEGNIYATGAAVQWMGEMLGLESGQQIELAAREVEDNGGVYFVPAFSGLGAPHWDDRARGTMTGITRGATTGHLARAALEAIAFQIGDVFSAIQADTGSPLTMLLADGGASRNNLLMQFQADLLDCPVQRSAQPELSAMGAAYLAGLAVGFWADLAEIQALARESETFEPRMPASQRQALLDGWQDAVYRATVRR